MITTILRLDVGGQTFATTLGTLTRDPSSKLAKLAYDKWLAIPNNLSSSTSQQHSTIFIDRDPTHFRYILNYLRDGDAAVLADRMSANPQCVCSRQDQLLTLRELLREAEFYELKNLQLKIRSMLNCSSSSGAVPLHASSASAISRSPLVTFSTVDNRMISPDTRNDLSRTTSHEWVPKCGDLVQWTENGFEVFWKDLSDKIAHRGYIDWLYCIHCDNDYEVRLPESSHALYGWKNVKRFLLDMKGKLESHVNEKCVYVNWKSVYCGKDGYLDCVRFLLHVPIASLKPLVL